MYESSALTRRLDLQPDRVRTCGHIPVASLCHVTQGDDTLRGG